MSEKIGFIGLGIMGRGMVDNSDESRLRGHRLEPHRQPHGTIR